MCVKLSTMTYWNDWLLKTQFKNDAMQFVAVYIIEPRQNLCILHWRSFLGSGSDISAGILVQ